VVIHIGMFDEIGYWTEIKLKIIREYASAYSLILSSQKKPPLSHIYIDAFAGSGVQISRTTGRFVLGSPMNVLLVKPPFKEYHLIDLDGDKVEFLRDLTHDNEAVRIYHGDCNHILVNTVFPRVRYEDYRRGLCLLDPYGLHLNWHVIKTASQMGTIDLFINFPVMDMNRNVLWKNPRGVDRNDICRMNSFWGDESWKNAAYRTQPGLFGPMQQKMDNIDVVNAFRERLINIAGFSYVPEPLPMRNKRGAVIYYLFFASQKPTAEHIINDIFNKYKKQGVKNV